MALSVLDKYLATCSILLSALMIAMGNMSRSKESQIAPIKQQTLSTIYYLQSAIYYLQSAAGRSTCCGCAWSRLTAPSRTSAPAESPSTPSGSSSYILYRLHRLKNSILCLILSSLQIRARARHRAEHPPQQRPLLRDARRGRQLRHRHGVPVPGVPSSRDTACHLPRYGQRQYGPLLHILHYWCPIGHRI